MSIQKIRKPTSATGRANMRRRHKIYFVTNGHCFYCGGPVTCDTIATERDWIFPHPRRHDLACEHKTPVIRGGADDHDNFVPSCRACNTVKGAFTFDEYRLLCGLRAGSLNHAFAGEAGPPAERDWLICHSPSFERPILVHNMPAADEGFRLRNGWARGRRAAIGAPPS